MKNKKILGFISFLGVIALVSGGFFLLTRSNSLPKNGQAREKASLTLTQTVKTSSSRKEEKTTSESSKEVKESANKFNETAVANDFYVELMKDGKVTLEKATKANLEELEKEKSSSEVSIYQVVQDGKLISVISRG